MKPNARTFKIIIALVVACLILSMLVAVAFIRTASVADVELAAQMQIPPSWPSFLPFPENIVIYDASIEEITAGRLSHVAMYNSLRSPNDILGMYKSALGAAGWEITETADPYITAQKKDDFVTVQINTNTERAGVEVLVTADIAKK